MKRWMLTSLLCALLAASVGVLLLRSKAPERERGGAARGSEPGPQTLAAAAPPASAEELAAARQELLECRSRLNFAQLAQGRPLLRMLTKEELQGLTLEQFRSSAAECKQQLSTQPVPPHEATQK